MIDNTTPPRFAQALAGVFLRNQEVDSVTGDLLEEYREVRHAQLGKRRADLWYLAHALSIVGHVVWPAIVAVIALRVLSFPLPRGWNPSLVPSPGTSMLDIAIFAWAAYHGAKRTGRVITGVLSAVVVALVGFGSFFVYAIFTDATLIVAPIKTPFVMVIFCVLLTIAMAVAVAAGIVGSSLARWRQSTSRPAA